MLQIGVAKRIYHSHNNSQLWVTRTVEMQNQLLSITLLATKQNVHTLALQCHFLNTYRPHRYFQRDPTQVSLLSFCVSLIINFFIQWLKVESFLRFILKQHQLLCVLEVLHLYALLPAPIQCQKVSPLMTQLTILSKPHQKTTQMMYHWVLTLQSHLIKM